jgi:hypothetical protein
MPIEVVCPGCQKRFNVSEKHAGKKGPCPNCKTEIKVPAKSEAVVVHEPEAFGPKGRSGKAVLKPIARTETKVSPLLTAIIIVTTLTVLGIAWALRSPEGDVSMVVLLLGAIGLAPPLAWAGYTFLRDDELEPYRGRELWLRVAACAAVYAVLWGLVAIVSQYVLGGERFEIVHIAVLVPVLVAIGASAAYLSLDLEYGIGALHYGLYLVVTVLLRLILGLSAL